MNLILGSASPRRVEILNFFNLPFVQKSPHFDEESVAFHGDPVSYACLIARGKAASLVEEHPDSLILTADTVVFREGQVYGKPTNTEEAYQMLRALAGHWHSVHTALTLRKGHEEYTASEETRVLFHPASDEHLQKYLKHISHCDKAGAYAIQGAGGLIVQRIEGCYYNVMGLPLNTLHKLLLRLHLDLWDFLK